jgi:hypothetical protein
VITGQGADNTAATQALLTKLGNAILSQVNAGNNLLQDATFGLQALRNTIDTNAALATIQYNDLVTRIGTRQESGVAVTLPAVAPGGYGGASSSDVWDYVPTPGYPSMGFWQTIGGPPGQHRDANNLSVIPTASNAEGWLVSGDFSNFAEGSPTAVDLTPIRLDSILATDLTYAAWLARVAPAMTLYYDQGRAAFDQAGSSYTWHVAFSPADFQIYQATVLGIGAKKLLLPPVWPGLAKVTTLTPVDLAVGVTITEPMDGVLVEITSVPAVRGWFSFDAVKSYRNIGALTFTTDDGEQEYPQTLGFTSAVYMCKSMVRASGVRIRTSVDVVGTVTPFTIT